MLSINVLLQPHVFNSFFIQKLWVRVIYEYECELYSNKYGNCRLTALYFWYAAGLVQPYYGIELHLRDYLNVCLSISPINMRLLND